MTVQYCRTNENRVTVVEDWGQGWGRRVKTACSPLLFELQGLEELAPQAPFCPNPVALAILTWDTELNCGLSHDLGYMAQVPDIVIFLDTTF